MDFDKLYGAIKPKSNVEGNLDKPTPAKMVAIFESAANTSRNFVVVPSAGTTDLMNVNYETKPKHITVDNFDALVREIFEEV